MKCIKCGNEFEPSRGLVNYCSLKCRSGRTWSNADKLKKSVSAKNSIKVKIANEQLARSKWVDRIKSQCPVCGINFESYPSRIRIYCSKKCYLIDNTCKFRKSSPGGYRIGSGRSKGSYYKDQHFDSLFEIEVAQFLEKNGINWQRNTKRFYFEWDGNQTYYIPDFLIDNDLYLETKGYWWGDKKERTLKAVRVNKLNWIELMQRSEWEVDKNILLEKMSSSGRID